MNEHEFYCLNCGKKSIPLARKKGIQRSKFHRKKLYCPWCKMVVNHIECKTYQEVQEFKEEFARGTFAEEAKESVAACGKGII